jgi:UDP-N-acetylmuramoylalanine-D-glutamate ligase
VRLTYAMKTEGLEPSETALNCYLAGKRQRHKEWMLLNGNVSIPSLIVLENQHENILVVECSQFDVSDRKSLGDRKVRIIF